MQLLTECVEDDLILRLIMLMKQRHGLTKKSPVCLGRFFLPTHGKALRGQCIQPGKKVSMLLFMLTDMVMFQLHPVMILHDGFLMRKMAGANMMQVVQVGIDSPLACRLLC